MSNKKGSVTVSLAGHRFSIRSEHSEAHLQNLASYVDRKVRELQRLSKTVGTQQLALLAAMNIADELFAAEQRQRDFKQRVHRKSENLLRAVEMAIASQNAARDNASSAKVPGHTGTEAKM
ncbi:MAG: cell division protein ZapA [Myxococcota bacterium]